MGDAGVPGFNSQQYYNLQLESFIQYVPRKDFVWRSIPHWHLHFKGNLKRSWSGKVMTEVEAQELLRLSCSGCYIFKIAMASMCFHRKWECFLVWYLLLSDLQKPHIQSSDIVTWTAAIGTEHNARTQDGYRVHAGLIPKMVGLRIF